MTMVCDFCSHSPVTQSYPAKTFDVQVQGTTETSITGWAACDICHGMIQRGDVAGLALRSLNFLLSEHPWIKDYDDEAYADIVKLHNQFYANRSGEPTPARIESNEGEAI